MKIKFLGAAHEVTGSCTLLEVDNKKIMIDCGMEQGIDVYENTPLPCSPSEIDCLLLTHAHIDHSGRIPQLVKNGFRGKIYTTLATTKLCEIMLLDSAHIQEFEAKWKNRKAKRAGNDETEPMYTSQDALKSLEHFYSCDYDKEYKIYDNLIFRFIDAGHLLGSASIEITAKENGIKKTILFSGDIGNIDRPLIKNPTKPEKADIVITESTYGNRLHGERSDYVSQLSQIIETTLSKGGNVVIPSFAVGRTQELLYLIHNIKEKRLLGNLSNFPVFIDSPLAVESTKIYDSGLIDYYDDEMLDYIRRGIDVLTFDNLHFAVTSDESMRINTDTTPKVIISASGMCEAGRIRHHLKHNLWKETSTILFVGYQSEGTLGRKLVDGADSVKLFGEEIKVNARIAEIDGISGHADKNMLLSWLENIKNRPEKVFINHGSDISCTEFSQSVRKKLGLDAVAPFNGAEFDLISGECLEVGNKVKIESRKTVSNTSSVYERLLLAGKRLLSVIKKNKGSTNKDNAKFADQIVSLCDKWDK